MEIEIGMKLTKKGWSRFFLVHTKFYVKVYVFYLSLLLQTKMKINEKNLCMFASMPPVDLEGWLNKRGEVNKSWQRRYFILKGNLLFYFEKRGDKEPLGVIILEGCTIGKFP